jgi:hypothetical protein
MDVAANHEYDNIVDALKHLNDEGYKSNFNLRADHLEDTALELKLYPEDFVVKRVYRFEGASDPGDNSIIYAIESLSGDIKGVLVNAYGAYSDTASEAIIAKLNYDPKNLK